jgi:dTDP-glucose pyrophosphorylase
MKHWEQTLIGPDATLRDALAAIDVAGSQIALVVDADRRLLGTLSDGDARRAMLRGLELGDRAVDAMYTKPTTVRASEGRDAILDTMKSLGLHQLPLLDDRGVVVGLAVVDDYLTVAPRKNAVVVMAGGLGTRLNELTRDVPKPMLKVGSRPLLETIVRSYAGQGFGRFFFAVNYRAEQIEQHFGDGSAFGVEIVYLREEQRLGTAGALSLLPNVEEHPLIVTNADLLTKEDYGAMIDRHMVAGVDATLGVRDYEMQVPFGVVVERNGFVHGIEEKPTHRYLVSAGIQVLSPAMVALVPPATFFDMPSLFDLALANGMKVGCHRIDGYWIDIGRMSDYERANADFARVFR